ncbi:transposase, putative [Ixodes scapularis]|uniref:Transposase, putative n=1 Tax=Ixodes scapularis TaxID=6945 RepID=B7PQY0_IXOSC|nr:transposase, putative [Ixodes scapularis]|eukprot:XP_002436172.1 transposase, putative [Ixodes scapularis]
MDTAEASATDIVHIPGGCTGTLQPVDVYWNKSLKDSLRTSWAEFMRKGDKTPKGNLRKPSRQDVLNFVSKAWATVPEDMIARSFKGCGISGALHGSEDGYLHNGLVGIGAPAACSNPEGVSDECVDLVFCSDSEESFDGFSDNE